MCGASSTRTPTPSEVSITVPWRSVRSTWRNMSTSYDKVRLPTERSGSLMLFTVHDRMSYGLIVEGTVDMRVGDYIQHPSVGHRDTGLATSYGS